MESIQLVAKICFSFFSVYMAQEKEDISWQALIHRVPRGVLAWAVRAGTNSLATPDNLARWGFKVYAGAPVKQLQQVTRPVPMEA